MGSKNEKVLLPAAAQPDIVRSNQKDQFYLKYINDQVFDLVNKSLGKLT
jgi:hypothetical protein